MRHAPHDAEASARWVISRLKDTTSDDPLDEGQSIRIKIGFIVDAKRSGR